MAADDVPRVPKKPATDLSSTWEIFDPMLAVDPETPFYVPRTDHRLQQLAYELEHTEGHLHAFLCGHRGSGKTTELHRLRFRPGILEKYIPFYLTAQDFGKETVHLTHDALMVEMGLTFSEAGKKHGMDKSLAKELDEWGRSVVKSFFHGEGYDAEAGAKASAWLAYFRASLKSRREWTTEQRQHLEPKVQDLIDIVNRMASDLRNRTDKQVLVIVDDLEKGESDAHREMHLRLFQEFYETLAQPRFSVVYTLPIYFRALPSNRIPQDELYAFSAIRIYERSEKSRGKPPLAKKDEGYRVMRRFVERRVENWSRLFESEEVLDELLLLGGGLFRETARAVRQAAYFAQLAQDKKITADHVSQVFDQMKKEYQPLIRGEAVAILQAVDASERGWVSDVEPYLQSRTVVEYENGDLWLDLRYALKEYVRQMETT